MIRRYSFTCLAHHTDPHAYVGQVTKSLNPRHLAEDVALFDWQLDSHEVQQLDAQNTPAAHPSFMCDA